MQSVFVAKGMLCSENSEKEKKTEILNKNAPERHP